MEKTYKQPSSYQTLQYACPYCKNVVKLNICTTRTIQVLDNPNASDQDILNELRFWDEPNLKCKHCKGRMVALDEHIAPIVLKLWSFGVRTYSSCEGHIGKRSFAKFDKEDYDYPIHSNRGYVHVEGIAAPYVDIVDNCLIGKAIQKVSYGYFEEYSDGFYCPSFCKLNEAYGGYDIYRLTVLPHVDNKTPRQKNHQFEVDASSPLIIVSRYFSHHSSEYNQDEIDRMNPIVVPDRSHEVEELAQKQLNICREVLDNTVSKILELRVSK